MIILGIETSCDETAISIVESDNGSDIAVLGDKTLSQIELHKQYGGVFPNMAKREHSKNLIPLLTTVLGEAGFLKLKVESSKSKVQEDFLTTYNLQLTTLLGREPEMLEAFVTYIPTIEKPSIDAIAVTEGPGLEPCLWTGINLAKALSLVWDVPIVPVNHMEGHIVSALLRAENSKTQSPKTKPTRSDRETTNYLLLTTNFPALALLISGGHTELVLIKNWHDYEIVGETQDDAVGEAFDKVARLLGLPYPGGPEISRLAEEARVGNSSFTKGGGEPSSRRISNPSSEDGVLPLRKGESDKITLPRPMLHSKDLNFSFSGIKTSVLYLIKNLPELTDELKKEIALEFENAVTEVLITKTKNAALQYGARALLLGGGVVANTHIRKEFEKLAETEGFELHIPERGLTTDNALMIAVAGLIRNRRDEPPQGDLRAHGNLRLN